jgi:peptidoglycan/LPS O-acetylase OafA/YrhL
MEVEKPEFGGRLHALDGWRAVSILAVIFGHLARWSSIGSERPINVLVNSWAILGVQVFFFISGFVICRGLFKEEQEFESISLVGFYLRRFCRIIPPLLLFIVVAILLTSAGLLQSDIPGLLRGLTFTCNLGPCGGWTGGHLWSLSAEEQFYLVIPILFATLLSHPKIAISLLAVGMPAVALALYAIHYTDAALLLTEDFQSIALGIACAIYELKVRRWARRAPGWLVTTAAIVMIFAYDLPASRLATIVSLFLPPAIAIIVLRSLGRSSWLQRLLLISPIQFIGRISYSLYLWQQLTTGPYPHAGVLFYVIAVLSAFGVASASWFFVEQPAIGIAKKISRSIRERRLARSEEPA